MLVMEAFEKHVPRGYVYFAMAFSLAVELLNLRMRARAEAPVKLHHRFENDPQAKATAREQLELDI
jgi:predicted tellurium resistance membrane protein TerC